MTEFATRHRAAKAQIAAACLACGRDPAEVSLLAVSKTQPIAAILDAMQATDQRTFGENRVRELEGKASALASHRPAPTWHLIGSLQTNKVGAVLEVPGLVLLHSLDRVALADALERRLAERGRSLEVLLQIEATGEDAKHGVAPGDAPALLEHVLERCPHVRCVGVMAIGPLEGEARPVFEAVAALRVRLVERSGLALPVVSLGMSGDLEDAIAAGSTLVRLGTALFGARAG